MRMRKVGSIVLSILLVASLLLAGCGSKAQAPKNAQAGETDAKKPESTKAVDKVITMDVNNPLPATHHFAYNALEPWKKIVEEKTNGRVKVNLVHGGGLGDVKTVLQDVNGGVYDVGIALTTYFYDSELFPFLIANLPFAFKDSRTASKVVAKIFDKYGKDKLKNSIWMGTSATDPYQMFTTKPMRNVNDFVNKKMRIAGKGDSEIVKEWGGVPTTVSNNETYEAFQKGMLDTAFYTTIGALSFKWYEVAPHITKVGITVSAVVPLMNRDFYEKLPEDLQKLFRDELNPKLGDLLLDSYTSELDKALAELEKEMKARGGGFIDLTPEEMKKLQAPAQKQWDKWVQDANKKGYPGDEMMKDFKEMLRQEGQLSLP